MKSTINYKLRIAFKLFFLVATIASQGCSPGETYSSSKNLLNQSGSSAGADGSVNPNPSANPTNPVNGPSCSWQWADDFAPPTPMNLRPPLKNLSCTQANAGQKQNVIDDSADWTCLCTAPPVSAPTPSPTPPSATPTPTPPPLAGADLCAGQTVYTSTPVVAGGNGTLQNTRRVSGNWYSDARDIPPGMSPGDIVVIPFNVAATVTTQGRFPDQISFSDQGPNRAGRLVTVSQRRCDFSPSIALWISAPANIYPLGGNSFSGVFILNDTSAAHAGMTNLTTGQWYINVKLPTGSCPTGEKCDFVMDYYGL